MGSNARKVDVGAGKKVDVGAGKKVAKSRRPGQKTNFALMTIVAGNRGQTSDNFLKFLKAHPEFARELGKAFKRSRANFAIAYPGETREDTFTNAEWKRGGYDYVADVNNAMGLRKS